MAIHPYEERWQAKPLLTGNGGFTEADLKTNGSAYLYHAIHINSSGLAKLAGAGERVDGSFVSFDGDGSTSNTYVVFSFRQKGMRFRSGANNTAIDRGDKIIGAERSGLGAAGAGSQRYGYVDAYVPITLDSAADTKAMLQARGIVRDPGTTPELKADTGDKPKADLIVEFGFE